MLGALSHWKAFIDWKELTTTRKQYLAMKTPKASGALRQAPDPTALISSLRLRDSPVLRQQNWADQSWAPPSTTSWIRPWNLSQDSGGSRISRRGDVELVGGGVDSQGGYISKILYVKTKELGPLRGGAPGAPP